MLKGLIAYLLGTLRIEITGGSFERFLNLALSHQIRLWEIERTTEIMRATLTVADFRAIRPVARGSRCRVRVRQRMGLPFRLQRLKSRPVLLLGFVAAVATILWAASHVWIVEVRITGPGYLDRRAVAAVAGEAGLRPRALRSRVDLPAVVAHIQQRVPEVSWVVIRLQGTRAVIEVVEKATVRPPNQSICVHLVARKSGVVEQVIPFQGEPLVKKGDIVSPGDLLVECAFRYYAGGRPAVFPGTPLPPRQEVARTTVAQGSVKARVSYRQYVEYPTTREVLTPTGRRESQWVLKWQDRSILLRGSAQSQFDRFESSVRSYSLGQWRSWKSPVELVIHDRVEVTARREVVPTAELLERARASLQARLAWLLGPSDKLLHAIKTEVADVGQAHIGILVSVEALEEIATPLEGSGPVGPVPTEPSVP